MNNALKRGLAAALFTIAGMSVALAHGFTLGELKIGHPWAKPTITGAKVGGGFMKITNEGKRMTASSPSRLFPRLPERSSFTR